MTKTNQIIQAAYVVDDLDAAIRRWLKSANIGPFFIMPNVRPETGLYRGRPAPLEMSIAFVQAGPVQLEFIQPLSEEPNIYRDSVPFGRDGFHHVSYFTDDFDEELGRYHNFGIQLAYQATFGAMRFAYFDTSRDIQCMTEVMEEDDLVRGMFKMIAGASVDWDGSDPIRTIG